MGYFCDFYSKKGKVDRVYFSTDPDPHEIKTYANRNLGGDANICMVDCFHDSEENYQKYSFDGKEWIDKKYEPHEADI